MKNMRSHCALLLATAMAVPAGLVGCCGMMQTWQCFYGSGGTPQTTCASNGGTWSTTSP
jgi:hypothetical protein